MAEPLFISQQELEIWVEEGKVSLEDNVLTLLAEGASYQVVPAVRILGLLDGQDAAGLVGTTQSVADLEAMGAEHFRDSLILGDTAYQCDEGFLGTPSAGAAMTPAPEGQTPDPASAEATDAGGPKDHTESDAELLTAFLLKHL
ncbi:MAG: hypothetical protein V3T05_12785 [Myxococcota bacterium]